MPRTSKKQPCRLAGKTGAQCTISGKGGPEKLHAILYQAATNEGDSKLTGYTSRASDFEPSYVSPHS
jgi:hypothetical protein